MQIKILTQRFKFSLVATLVTLLAITVMVKLGFWQLSRAAEKQQRLQQLEKAQQQQLLSVAHLQLLQKQGEDIRDYPIFTQGEFVDGYWYLLDNKINQGKVGYQLLGLFKDMSNVHLLINLGWIPLGHSREVLPEVPILAGKRQLTGNVYSPPENPFQLAKTSLTQQWPQVIQQIDLPAIQQQLEMSLAPFIIQLGDDPKIPYPREWQAVVMPPEKHYGYAVQWFGLALACLIVYLFASKEKEISHEKR